MITVLGLGFVGLTTALGFCDKGVKVFGFDVDQEKTASLKNGNVPFFEPNLDDKLQEHLGSNFEILDQLTMAVENSNALFICVGTPSDDEGKVDLTFVKSAVKAVSERLNPGEASFKTIIIKSTAPPSTTKEVIAPYIEELGLKIGRDVGLASNPEFLREGYAWDDFMNPDRIVMGVLEEKSCEILKEIYKDFEVPLVFTTLNSAEFIKYLSNTLLATLISYSNDMSMVASAFGDIDIAEAFKILHMDKRWSGNPSNMASYVYPGCGFGGYCLPKDTAALYNQARAKGYTSGILSEVLNVNSSIGKNLVQKIINSVDKSSSIALLGLSFKPDSDDVRDSPSLRIIKLLLDYGYPNLIAFDPIAIEVFHKAYQLNIHYAKNLEDAVAPADAVVILTAWKEFIQNKAIFTGKKIFDFRYCL